MAKGKAAKTPGVYDRGSGWQVRMTLADRHGVQHRIGRWFAYDANATASSPHSRTTRLREASAFAAAERAALRIEKRPRSQTTDQQTLRKWLDDYEAQVTPRKKSANRERSTLSQLRMFLAEFLDRPIVALTSHALVGVSPTSLTSRMSVAGYKSGTVRRYLVTLSHVFTVAGRQWGWEGPHLLRDIDKPVAHDERERTVSDAEWKAIKAAWGNTSPEVVAAIHWLRWTAARRGEACVLYWSDLQWATNPPTAFLRNTKAAYDAPVRGRHIPMPKPAVEALRALHPEGPWPTEGLVFGGLKPDSLTRAWIRICERAKVADLRLHDLRHTRTTEMAAAVPLQVLARITGHSDASMLLRYYNPKEREAAEAGRAIEAFSNLRMSSEA